MKKNIFLLPLLFVFGFKILFSQQMDELKKSTSIGNIYPKTNEPQTSQPKLISQNNVVVQDGPIDPQEYIVGPGDLFSINIWSTNPLFFQETVTPDGSLIVPTVNVIPVSGISLDSVQKIVLTEIKKKYSSGNISFTLVMPREFTVTVRGMVLNEGTFVVQATQRIDGAINVANDKKNYKEESLIAPSTSEELDSKNSNKLLEASKRYITVLRKNGTIIHADIQKYYATHNPKLNPLLHDGDVVIVPKSDVKKNFVGIYGAVAEEGKYEYDERDTPRDLIMIAGGLTSISDSGRILISRILKNGVHEEIPIDLRKKYEGGQDDLFLQKGDLVIVGEKRYDNTGGVINIEGEVRFPGAYPIVKDSTKLSKIIRQAGGFTKYASLNGAYVVHKKFDFIERKDSYLDLIRGYTTAEDTIYTRNAIQRKSTGEYVSVDFERLFKDGDSTADIILHDGDQIIIPTTLHSVYIFGEVKNPGYVEYKPLATLDYYLELAGGINDDAKLGDLKVIKRASKQWLNPSETTIEEGDFIWVPKKPFRTLSYYLDIYSKVFGIVGTIATLYLLVNQIK